MTNVAEMFLENLGFAMVNCWVGAEARRRTVEEMIVVAAEHFGNADLANDAVFVAAVEKGVRDGPYTLSAR